MRIKEEILSFSRALLSSNLPQNHPAQAAGWLALRYNFFFIMEKGEEAI